MALASEPLATLKDQYKDLLDRVGTLSSTTSPSTAEAVARAAYQAQPARASAQKRTAAVRKAVVEHLALNTPATATAAGNAFDTQSQKTADADVNEDTLASAAKDAASTVADTADPPTFTLKLSQPSMLSASWRAGMAIAAAALAALFGGGIFALSYRNHTSTGSSVGLGIGLASSVLVLLVLVMGYGNVEIDLAKGSAEDKSSSTTATK